MGHALLSEAMLERGLHPQLVRCLLRELLGFQASLSVPGARATEKFPVERGGKRGGAETPDEFNIFFEVIPETLLTEWARRGFGFSPGDRGSEAIAPCVGR